MKTHFIRTLMLDLLKNKNTARQAWFQGGRGVMLPQIVIFRIAKICVQKHAT